MGGAATVSEEQCFLSGYVLSSPEGLSHSKKNQGDPNFSKFLSPNFLSLCPSALSHSWIQHTTLKGGAQQTCQFRKYLQILYCLHLCSIPPPAFGTAAHATRLTEKYGKVLVLFYTYLSFPLFHLYV